MKLNIKAVLLGIWIFAFSSLSIAEPFPCSLMAPDELAALKTSKALIEARPRTMEANVDWGTTEPLQAIDCFVKMQAEGSGKEERTPISVSVVLNNQTIIGVKKALSKQRELAESKSINESQSISTAQVNRNDVMCMGALLPGFPFDIQYSVCIGLGANRIVFVSTEDRNLLGAAAQPISTLYQFDRVVKQIEEDLK